MNFGFFVLLQVEVVPMLATSTSSLCLVEPLYYALHWQETQHGQYLALGCSYPLALEKAAGDFREFVPHGVELLGDPWPESDSAPEPEAPSRETDVIHHDAPQQQLQLVADAEAQAHGSVVVTVSPPSHMFSTADCAAWPVAVRVELGPGQGLHSVLETLRCVLVDHGCDQVAVSPIYIAGALGCPC